MNRKRRSINSIVIGLILGCAICTQVSNAQNKQETCTIEAENLPLESLDAESIREAQEIEKMKTYQAEKDLERIKETMRLMKEETERQQAIMEAEKKAEEKAEEEEKIRIAKQEEDIIYLAEVMYAEQGIYLKKYGKRVFQLTGSVIIHRANCGYLGATTIQEVVNTKGQYASRTKKLIGNQEIPEVVYEWARELIVDGPIGPKNMIYQDSNQWGPIYEKIGNQYFCLEE